MGKKHLDIPVYIYQNMSSRVMSMTGYETWGRDGGNLDWEINVPAENQQFVISKKREGVYQIRAYGSSRFVMGLDFEQKGNVGMQTKKRNDAMSQELCVVDARDGLFRLGFLDDRANDKAISGNARNVKMWSVNGVGVHQ